MKLLRKSGLTALVCSAFALAACAAPSTYMGISLNSTTTDAVVRQQALRAMRGDKQSQLELGIRFEEGLGVRRDLRKAKKLYLRAASDSGGTVWVYSPPVGNGTSGRVIPIQSGANKSGIIEAKHRLSLIKAEIFDDKK